jgi:hypothetical protein
MVKPITSPHGVHARLALDTIAMRPTWGYPPGC